MPLNVVSVTLPGSRTPLLSALRSLTRQQDVSHNQDRQQNTASIKCAPLPAQPGATLSAGRTSSLLVPQNTRSALHKSVLYANILTTPSLAREELVRANIDCRHGAVSTLLFALDVLSFLVNFRPRCCAHLFYLLLIVIANLV